MGILFSVIFLIHSYLFILEWKHFYCSYTYLLTHSIFITPSFIHVLSVTRHHLMDSLTHFPIYCISFTHPLTLTPSLIPALIHFSSASFPLILSHSLSLFSFPVSPIPSLIFSLTQSLSPYLIPPLLLSGSHSVSLTTLFIHICTYRFIHSFIHTASFALLLAHFLIHSLPEPPSLASSLHQCPMGFGSLIASPSIV